MDTLDHNKTTMTSESYTKMVEEIEAKIKAVKAQNDPNNKQRLTELKKEKRALKNKASAMRCREKKRRRMEDLERTVLELNKKLMKLEQENKQLRMAAGGKPETVIVASPRRVPVRKASHIISDSRVFAPDRRRVKIEQKPKVSQSRTHAVFAPLLCHLFRTFRVPSEGSPNWS